MLKLLIIAPIALILLSLLVWFIYDRYKRQKNIILLSKLSASNIIEQQSQKKQSDENFKLKLIQAGASLKEYNEARFLFAVIGSVLIFTLPFFFSFNMSVLVVIIGLMVITFGGQIFLYIGKSERVGKIEKDLGVFLDLTNVILEAGGGLKNAFFKVSQEAKYIMDDELLKEIGILEYEMSNYSTKVAYENLKKRVDSRDLDKIVDFLILSEETGLGVKNIFSTQSDEMRQKEFYRIKGKANTLSLYLTLIIFVFILPTLGAFIVFPMMAGSLNLGM
ncbi:MAG: type II secretion system F family protein [Campylobacteraceae bacterium]|nr:type II secretion system F family protein [Campylobacteraceae bacterium]